MERRIKVAYFLTPITFGGSESVSLNFLKGVDKNVFDIHLILFLREWEKEAYFVKQLRKEGFTFTIIPLARSFIRGVSESLLCFAKICNLLREGCFDLAHSHGYRADVLCIPAAKIVGIPHVTTCHGFVNADRKLQFYNKLDKAMIRFSDRVICVSENIKSVVLQTGVSEKMIKVIPNAVVVNNDKGETDLKRAFAKKRLGAEDNDLVIGFIGRLSEEKGLKWLILSFAEIIQLKPNCKLILLGDGPQRSELRDLCSSIGILDRVFFLGFCENPLDIAVGMDVFVLPSLTEGTPMALLEAMSIGIPSVASDVGQIPQIIRTGENGILIRPRDSIGIAEAILRVINDKAFATRLSVNAMRTVERAYSIGPWVEKIELIYLELLKEH